MFTFDIVIADYSSLSALAACHKAVAACDFTPHALRRVVVVNNRGLNGVSRVLTGALPTIILHAPGEGWAEACNKGFCACTGDYTVFMTEDVSASPGALQAAIARAIERGYGYMGVAVRNGRREISKSVRFPGAIGLARSHSRMRAGDDALLTGFLVVRSALFAKLGGYDAGLDSRFAAIALCKKLAARGVEPVYEARVAAEYGAGEAAKSPADVFSETLESIKSRLYYINAFMDGLRARLARFLTLHVESALYLLAMPFNRNKAKAVRLAYRFARKANLAAAVS